MEIKETQKELNNKLENQGHEGINSTFRKNDEINRKHLKQRKIKSLPI